MFTYMCKQSTHFCSPVLNSGRKLHKVGRIKTRYCPDVVTNPGRGTAWASDHSFGGRANHWVG